jgi:basic amino acid/polyamine antiporter, APA family
MATLVRRLGVFDVLLIVMGSVVGSGIFRAPSVVAQRVHSPPVMLGAWVTGGIVALFGAVVLGELAARRPDGCGAYAYLRDAFHPVVAFAYGWTSLLVSLTGGIAAAAVLFAGYFEPLTNLRIAPAVLAVTAILALTLVNFLGVRMGGGAQNAFMLLKVAGLGAVIVAGFFAHPAAPGHGAPTVVAPIDAFSGFGVAMIPVLFAYNGAAVATFMTRESKNAGHAFPVGLWGGMLAVIVLYVLVNIVCIRVLGTMNLANTATPASDVVRLATGPVGERVVALAIVISTLGFISNRILTAPRLYHAMAQDGLFFRQLAWIDPKTRVPTLAIALQSVFAISIALSGSYERILNYVVSTTYVFTGLLAVALFVIRAKDRHARVITVNQFRAPWHPISTIVVLAASWAVAIDTFVTYPRDGLIGIAILLSAIPAYFIFVRQPTPPALKRS